MNALHGQVSLPVNDIILWFKGSYINTLTRIEDRGARSEERGARSEDRGARSEIYFKVFIVLHRLNVHFNLVRRMCG